MSRRWPVPTAERAVPAGPCTSTTRRPARYCLSVRDASSSISAHAASETGASSRCRLFILTVSFEGADAERTVTRGRAWCGLRGGRSVRRDFLEECRGRHEEEIAGHCPAEVEQPVVISGRTADEHVLEHLLDGARRPAVADEISAELALRRLTEGHVVAQDLDLAPVLLDHCQRAVSGGWLGRVVQLDVRELGAAD